MLNRQADCSRPGSGRKKPKTIGTEGARKLHDLASQKGVCLDEYLAAADVSESQPLAEVAPEPARQVWRTLQALPDPAAPATNGLAPARSSVPF
jgi:hypothetical protein